MTLRVLLSVLSGLLLSIPFLSPQYYGLAWIGFIPLLIAIEGAGLFRSYLLGTITGLMFSISISYWMIDFLMLSKGYDIFLSIVFSATFWLYCAQLFGFITLLFNAIKLQSKVHEYIIFPIIVVSVFTLYPLIFSAHLGESQSQFLIAIQGIEFVGVYGLDAIIALSNIVMFRFMLPFLTANQQPTAHKKWPVGIALLVLTSWFYYGWSSNLKWQEKIAQWDTVRIGLVQPNETPSLEKEILYPGYSRAFPPEMAMTQHLASRRAEIVIWPEAKYKAYFDQSKIAEAYQHQIKTLNIRLIFQDIDRSQLSINSAVKQQYNSAVMLSEKGELIGQYQKMKRIAFGEYVPFASDIPILKRWVEGFFGSFLNEMEKGESHQVFSTVLTSSPTRKSTFNIIPLICYETIFPEFVAEAVADALSKVPNTDLLVALSSDGWFGPTHQPYQHVNASILRAVENRIPLAHVLNNGPSIVAMPNGQVIFKTPAHQAGGYVVDVPYKADSKGSFFSHYPKLFIYSVYGLMLLILLSGILKARKKTPEPTVLVSARNEPLN